MNFNELFSDPRQYIENLAQFSEERPDFGLKRMLDEYFTANPDAYNNIPIVSSMGQLNMHQPGALVRLRCIFIKSFESKYVVFRLKNKEGKYLTSIIDNEFPQELMRRASQDIFEKQIQILVMSVPSLSSWLIDLSIPEQPKSNFHINLEESPPINYQTLFEEPFQVIIKAMHDIPEKIAVMHEMVGFLEEPTGLLNPTCLDSTEDFMSPALPGFVLLTSTPITSLFSPTIPPPVPSFSEIRAHLINTLTAVFEPSQAELILIWLVSRIQKRTDEVFLGQLSLNFFGVTPELASPIINFIRFLCTAVTCVSLDCDSLNAFSLKPSVKNCEFKPTSLSSAENTRFIIDETKLEEGNFSKLGTENLFRLKKVITEQIVDYFFEIDDYEVPVSFPALILSNSKSILDPKICFPIGNIKQANISLDPSMLTLLRLYVEEARFHKFILCDEDSDYISNSMKNIMGANPAIREELHTLMIINTLNCISLGAERVTPEIWEHSVAIVDALIPHKKVKK